MGKLGNKKIRAKKKGGGHLTRRSGAKSSGGDTDLGTGLQADTAFP